LCEEVFSLCCKYEVAKFDLKKRQEKSEFWCAESRVEFSRRGFGGEFVSFEGLYATY
jgi:hypothetical protein